MRTVRLLAFLVLLAPASAHAMGSEVDVELLAWSDDGTAALTRRTSTMDRDRQVSYQVIAASDTADVLVTSKTLDTSASPSDAPRYQEQVRATDCERDVRALAASVAAHHLRSVRVDPARCRDVNRDPVVVTGSNVAGSWVALPQHREASMLERAARDVLRLEDPHYRTVALDDDCSGPRPALDEYDVAARSTKLVLVFHATRCNAPTKMDVDAFVPAKGGYARLARPI